MTPHFLPLAQTQQFSPLFLDYIMQKTELQPFYTTFPTIDAFGKAAAERDFDPARRQTLHHVLQTQYDGYDHPGLAAQIDSLLQPETYTVTTGHQLNLFSGPLYVIYKLVTVTNLAARLNAAYPGRHFVPVYWMATEDHDFAEINHFQLFGKTYTWHTEQTGAVGRMHTREIEAVLAQLPDAFAVFEDAYRNASSLADATRRWATALFGDQGLVCLDADHPDLKASFAPAMHTDLFAQVTFKTVTDTSARLAALGYKTQVNPRETNLFYLDGTLRERIVPQGTGFAVLNQPIAFTAAEMEKIIAESPQKLSPNVLLRPLYQETILPNLAYIGGPAEVAYWLQLKDLFGALQTPFPMLMPRNFALVVSEANRKKLEKTGLQAEDLFLDETALKRRYMERAVAEPVSLDAERQETERIFDQIVRKAVALDKTLEGWVGAERQKTRTSLENIEKRLKKTEEQKQETGLQQLMGLKAKLFPEGGPQERTDNFLNFQANRPDFLSQLHAQFDPFRYQLYILTD